MVYTVYRWTSDPAEVQVLETISERVSQLQVALWQAAIGEAERRLATERDDLTKASEAADAAVTDAQEAVTLLEDEAQARERQIEQLQHLCTELERRASDTETGPPIGDKWMRYSMSLQI